MAEQNFDAVVSGGFGFGCDAPTKHDFDAAHCEGRCRQDRSTCDNFGRHPRTRSQIREYKRGRDGRTRKASPNGPRTRMGSGRNCKLVGPFGSRSVRSSSICGGRTVYTRASLSGLSTMVTATPASHIFLARWRAAAECDGGGAGTPPVNSK